MDAKKQAKVNTLKSYVVKMSMFQAKLTLMMILEGSNFLEAIEYVFGLTHTLEKDLNLKGGSI